MHEDLIFTDPTTNKKGLKKAYPKIYSKLPKYSEAPIPAVYKIKIGPYYYIGKTLNLADRISTHFSKLLRGVHGSERLQNCFNWRGADLVDVVFRTFPNVTQLDELTKFEDLLILEDRNSPYLLNLLYSKGPVSDFAATILNYNLSKGVKKGWGKMGPEERKQHGLSVSQAHQNKSGESKKVWREKLSQSHSRDLMCKGIKYTSVKEASATLAVCPDTIRRWIKSDSHPNTFYL